MALNGNRLVSDRFPYLPLELHIGQQRLELEALVDTGFDGAVIVPPGVLDAGTEPDANVRWTLADGSSVVAPLFLGTVRLGGLGVVLVEVSVLGDEPLVGRELTDRFTLILDHGVRLIVEP